MTTDALTSSISGALDGVDPRLVDLAQNAWQQILPGATINVTTGVSSHSPTNHAPGHAIDFRVARPDGSTVMWDHPEARAAAELFWELGGHGVGAGPTYMGGSHFHWDISRNGVRSWSDDDGGASDRGPGAAGWLHGIDAPGTAGITTRGIGSPSTDLGVTGMTQSPEQRGGLLSFLGGGQRGGGVLGMDRDRQDMLAMSLMGMSMHPNEGLMRALDNRIQGRREDRLIADRRQREDMLLAQERQQEEESVNRTVSFIEQQVRQGNLPPVYLEMARVDPAAAYQGAVQALSGGQDQFRVLSSEEAQNLGLEEGSYQVGPDNRVHAIGSSGTNVTTNVVTGDGETDRYLYGPDGGVPQGWRVDTQGGRAEPIPGGPAAREIEDADAASERSGTQSRLMLGTSLQSLHENIREIESGGLPVTGVVGDSRRTGLGRALTGNDAVDFANRSAQITDAAAFAEIQRMRENSPTGGAVGNLSEGERISIGNAVTGLNASTSAEEYLRAARVYTDLILNLSIGEGLWSLNQDGTVSVLTWSDLLPEVQSQLRGEHTDEELSEFFEDFAP